ncbi:MAG: DUF4314 domain-containing protein [Firmicutes bacterium]|nr:DUF4314 domain-containing protein [Bacillota bacterium]
MYEREMKQSELLRKRYPAGTRLCLDYMEGEADMPAGLKGEVTFIDDIGQIHMKWENGRSLPLNVEADSFHRAGAPEKKRDKGEVSR